MVQTRCDGAVSETFRRNMIDNDIVVSYRRLHVLDRHNRLNDDVLVNTLTGGRCFSVRSTLQYLSQCDEVV